MGFYKRQIVRIKMILRLNNAIARLCSRQLSSSAGIIVEKSPSLTSKALAFNDPSSVSNVVSSVASVNSRLSAMSLTAQYLSGGGQLLFQPASSSSKVHLPTATVPRVISCPTLESLAVKNFIVEDSLKKVEEPLANKPKVEEPLKGVQIVEKRAIRMIVNRRIKMKKHQRKKLWQRMGLQFRRDRVMREKKKELEFRAILAAKVAAARKFSAEKYVNDYLEDYHKELLPKTYQGHRLPEWLIRELMEKDREESKERAMQGKEITTGQTIVKPGETVEQFIQRKWK